MEDTMEPICLDSSEVEEGEITSEDDIVVIATTKRGEFCWSDLNVLMVGDERILSICWNNLQGFPKQDLFYITGGNIKAICKLVDKHVTNNHDIVIIFGFHYDLCFYELCHGKQMKLHNRSDFIYIVDTVKEYSEKWRMKYPSKYFIWAMPYPIDFYQHNHHLKSSTLLFDDAEQNHLTELYYNQVEILFSEISNANISGSYIFNVNNLSCFKHIVCNLSAYLTNGLFPKKDTCQIIAYYFVEFLYMTVFPSKNKCNIDFSVAEKKLLYLKNMYFSYLEYKLLPGTSFSHSDNFSGLSDDYNKYLSDNSVDLSLTNHDHMPLSNLTTFLSSSEASSRASSQQSNPSSHLTAYTRHGRFASSLKRGTNVRLDMSTKNSENKSRSSKHNCRSTHKTRSMTSQNEPEHIIIGSQSTRNNSSSPSLEASIISENRIEIRHKRHVKRDSKIHSSKIYEINLQAKKRVRTKSHIGTSSQKMYKSCVKNVSNTGRHSDNKLATPHRKSETEQTYDRELLKEIDEHSVKETSVSIGIPKQQTDAKRECDMTNKDEEIQFWKALKRLKEVHDLECEVFRNNPSSHPSYAREKIKFFDDYYIAKTAKSKPWDEFWVIRMEELFQEKWSYNKIQLSLECSKLAENKNSHISQNRQGYSLSSINSGMDNELQSSSKSCNFSAVKNNSNKDKDEIRMKERYSECVVDKDKIFSSRFEHEVSPNSVLLEDNIDEEIDFDVIMEDPMFKQGLDDIDFAIKTVFKEESTEESNTANRIGNATTKRNASPIFPCVPTSLTYDNMFTNNSFCSTLDSKDKKFCDEIQQKYKCVNRTMNAEFLYIMKMLSRLSKHLGPIGHSLSEIYSNAKTSFDSSNNALTALDSDAKVVLDLVKKKMKNLLNEDLSTLHRAIYGEISDRTERFLKDLKFHSIEFPKIDMKNICVAIKEMDIVSAIEYIKSTLVYYGYFNFASNDLMNIYRSVQDYSNISV